MIYSEVSGTISQILVSQNQTVDKETNLLMIECMKMIIQYISIVIQNMSIRAEIY